jgi:hypothetical protein
MLKAFKTLRTFLSSAKSVRGEADFKRHFWKKEQDNVKNCFFNKQYYLSSARVETKMPFFIR